MEELMVKVENVSKQYKLGQIGGTTLREDLQRRRARRRGLEDPTRRIGAREYEEGETFLALDGVSFEVKKGERVGIIGHNGAGKSTLLKLLCRVTAPTDGFIGLNGRITSMLEVGTGFHGELTGRENIYMNGAILGMTRKEIDRKIEDIIDFSEVRKFIDTPVKRYSSGMYVKLAFAVAAHLDSEIMIMDEVLAVGDMAFQKKCLEKMSDVSKTEGRTILYVSHNMNTIRQLCSRVIVLDHGHIVFDGDVEEGIRMYLGISNPSDSTVDLANLSREKFFFNPDVRMTRLVFDAEECFFDFGDKVPLHLTIHSRLPYDGVILKMYFSCNGIAATTVESAPLISLSPNEDTNVAFLLDFGALAPAKYSVKMSLCRRNRYGAAEYLDVLFDCCTIEIVAPEDFQDNQKWNVKYNGFFVGPPLTLLEGAEPRDD